jgi:hypothetical protein
LRETAADTRRRAERELKRRFGWRTPFLLWLVRKLRAAMAAREAAKSALICLMLPIRRIVLEIGRRLVAEGKLPQWLGVRRPWKSANGQPRSVPPPGASPRRG